MNKKGGHVDWVISMGIFIVYVLALFILLRPGIKPVYRPTDLLNNLQANFENDIMWTVKTIPLFVRTCKPGAAGRTTEIIVDDQNNFWRISKAYLGNDPDNAVIMPLSCIGEISYFREIVTLIFEQTFKPYSSSNFPKLKLTCSDEDPTYCVAELGVFENINGLNPTMLTDITSDSVEAYKTLKTRWGIPEDKEFSIYIDRNVDGAIEKIIGADPFEKANVFVRRIESQIVEPIGTTTPVAVYLRVW